LKYKWLLGFSSGWDEHKFQHSSVTNERVLEAVVAGRPAKQIGKKMKNMKKVIAAFNMTLDGICDHTAGIADEGLHQHYSELIDNAGVILYGRTTYQLMQLLFDQIKDRILLNLIKTKVLNSGAIVLYYEPASKKTTNR
jgi:hypothetical protein